jgi:hypothetical protein
VDAWPRLIELESLTAVGADSINQCGFRSALARAVLNVAPRRNLKLLVTTGARLRRPLRFVTRSTCTALTGAETTDSACLVLERLSAGFTSANLSLTGASTSHRAVSWCSVGPMGECVPAVITDAVHTDNVTTTSYEEGGRYR